MKQLTINGNRILLAGAEEGETHFTILPNGDLRWFTGHRWVDTKLPPGSWQLLFADPLKPTEEEAAGVVVEYIIITEGRFYKDYTDGSFDRRTALESWNSLVTSHGFTPGRVVGMIDRKK